MAKSITLQIDGRPVEVPEGTLIISAARQIGIEIPVFCYHPKMEPVGMCRQCLVEVGRPVIDRATGQPVIENGEPKIGFGPKLETACTTVVSPGMVVRTRSEKARAGQKEILEFLLTSHPLDCPVCDKGGECPLQNLTLEHGPSESRFRFEEKHHAEKHVPLGDLIWLDRERCIQCARCIRFQESVAGEPVLAFYQRGRSTDIITCSEPPFDSIFSGNTTDICPVGALTTADFRFGARPWEMKAAASICPHCPVGCNLTLNTRRDAKSGGTSVIKRALPRQNEQVNEIWLCDKGRFATHTSEDQERLVRPLTRRNGKLAASSWAAALREAGKLLRDGPGRPLFLAGGQLSNEDLYNFKALAEGLGGEAWLASGMGGGEWTTALGVGPGTNFGEMGAGTVILVIASDLYQEAPLWHLRIRQAALRGATLIVAGGRATRLEAEARYVVRYSYGDEIETVASLASRGQIGAAIREAENLVVLFGSDGLGLEGSRALAAECAQLLKGRQGRPRNGLIGVWPHANDQGAWELGLQPLPDLAKAVRGRVVYLAGTDPAGDDPRLRAALSNARALIVQELFLTETAGLASVVLPARAVPEREGSFTSGERRVQRFYPAVPAPGEAREDFAITAAIGAELGVKLEGRSAAAVLEQIAGSVPAFAGLSFGRLAEVGPQSPAIGRGSLYYGGAAYENSQGLGVTLAPGGPAPSGKAAYRAVRPDEKSWLAVPVTTLYDRGRSVRASALLGGRVPPVSVRLHPDSAGRLKVSAGEELTLDGCRVGVILDREVPASVVLVPRSLGLPLHAPGFVKLKKA